MEVPEKMLSPAAHSRQACSDESEYTGSQQASSDEDSDSGDMNEDVPTKPRRIRTSTKWPADKITATEFDEDGFPTEKKAQRRMRRLAGLVARQQIPLVLDSVMSLTDEDKHQLFVSYCIPKLEIPQGLWDMAKKSFLRLVAKSFRTYKSHLVRNYVDKGLTPFAHHKHIKPKQWADFVSLKSTIEFREQSRYFKALRERNVFDHHLGTCGYEGKFEQWEAEDEMLLREGISNPWAEYPEGRCRSFLRARSKLSVSEGKAEIIWIGANTKEVAHKVKHKYTSYPDSVAKSCRENDILSECLGPEHTGRVRGFSSYKGWKHGFPESIEMYKKRKRVDYVALKAEIKVEIMEELMMMKVHQGGQTEPCYIPRTVGGRKSPSTPHGRDMVKLDNTADRILIDEPTACALLIHLVGSQIEVARGQMYPHQGDVHVQVLPGYAVVKVEYVHFPFRCHLLDPSPDAEITTLGQAIMHRIQWRLSDILLNPEPMDSSAVKNSSRTQLEPALHVSKKTVASGAPVSSSAIGNEEVSKCGHLKQDMQNQGGAPLRSSNLIAKDGELAVKPEFDMQMDEQKKVDSDQQMDKHNKVKKVRRSKGGGVHQMDKQNTSQFHSQSERPQRNVLSKYARGLPSDFVDDRSSGQGKKNRGGCSGQSKANPDLKFGEAILNEKELGRCGPSTVALHAYYFEACGQQKVDILIKFDRSQLWHTENSATDLVVGFEHLDGLFKLDALDVGLLRCFSLYMVQKVKDDGLPVGIMDPQMFLKSYIRANESSVVEYVKNMFNHFAKVSNSVIMVAHNTGKHWLAVVIIPKWNKVVYLDSDRSKQRDHGLLKSVINKAYVLSDYKKPDQGALSHATKFACHRQPNEKICGFYTAYHMTLATAAATCQDPSEFEVPNTKLDSNGLRGIQEAIATFVMSQLGK